MNRYRLLLLLFFCIHLVGVHGQRIGCDTIGRLHGDVELGTGVLSGFGHSLGYSYVSPSISYQVSDKLVLGGSVSVIKGWGSTPYQLRGREPHNRTPYRHQQLTSFSFEGTYQFNKNLTIAASLFYMDGYWNSMLCSNLNPTRVSMLGFEGLLSYQFGNNSRLDIYFSYIRGEGMPWGLYSPWYYSFLTHNHNMRFHHYMNMGWY